MRRHATFIAVAALMLTYAWPIMLAAPFAVVAWAVVAATAPRTPGFGGKADRLLSHGGLTDVALVVLVGLLLVFARRRQHHQPERAGA